MVAAVMHVAEHEPMTNFDAWSFVAFIAILGYLFRILVENIIASRQLKRDPTMPKVGRIDWTAGELQHILTFDAASGRAIDHTTVFVHPCGVREISLYDFKYKGLLKVTKAVDGTSILKEIWVPCVDCPWSAGHWSKINDDYTYDPAVRNG